MHYYIDGYNLIFRTLGREKDLKERRQNFIKLINDKITGLNLDVTIVFDSQYQGGETSRSHFYSLEILFTEKNETADDLILKIIKSKSNPQEVVVVTSDKQLALTARRYAAKSESGEQFLKWVGSKKIKKEKPLKREVSKKIEPPKEHKRKPKQEAKPEECYDYYLEAFEKESEKIRQSEIKKEPKKQKKEKGAISKSKKPKKNATEKGISDTERWLRLFEEKA